MDSWRTGKPFGPLSLLGLAIIILVLVLDQAVKLWVTAALPTNQAVDILPILALFRVSNNGIAFSIFAGSGAPLTIVTIVVTAVVVGFWLTTRDGGRLAGVGFALIVGGALGNLIDRVRLGYVVDFLWLHFGTWTLFVFNLADAALSLGPVLLLVTFLWPARSSAERA